MYLCLKMQSQVQLPMSLLIMDHVCLNFELQSSSSTISSSSGTPRRYRTLLHLQENKCQTFLSSGLLCLLPNQSGTPNNLKVSVVKLLPALKQNMQLYTIKELLKVICTCRTQNLSVQGRLLLKVMHAHSNQTVCPPIKTHR